MWISLLHDLDAAATVKEISLSSIASQDCLFLQHDLYLTPVAKDMSELQYIVSVTSTLLCTLREVSHHSKDTSPGLGMKKAGCKEIDCEEYIANLEHLIMCIHTCAMDAIAHHFLNVIKDTILRWYQLWLYKRGAVDVWFTEWPDGRHLLNRTWPWNVEPALLVLWGVCWMFFDYKGTAPWEPQKFGRSESPGTPIWTRQAAAFVQPSQPSRKYNPACHHTLPC